MSVRKRQFYRKLAAKFERQPPKKSASGEVVGLRARDRARILQRGVERAHSATAGVHFVSLGESALGGLGAFVVCRKAGRRVQGDERLTKYMQIAAKNR